MNVTNKGSGFYGTAENVNKLLTAQGNKLSEAFDALNSLGEDATAGEIANAQGLVQDERLKFDLLQEVRSMLTQIMDTIIRNINPR